MGFYSRSLTDYDGEKSTLQVYAADLNAGNIAAELTLQATFGAAINDMSLGSLQEIRYGNQVVSNAAAPAETYAQREMKWRVDYTDDVTGKPYHFTIPVADTSKLDANNRGFADPDDTDVAAFITATEAYVLSQDGNAITVQQIELVGRNI